MTEPKNYLSVRDVAKLLNVSSVSVRNYINAGHLQARKIGSWNRISRASVDQFLNSLNKQDIKIPPSSIDYLTKQEILDFIENLVKQEIKKYFKNK